MTYSVCLGNTELKRINPVNVDWNTPFMNLFFDREKARAKGFADNGKNWQYSDTDDLFKTVNMDVYLDDYDHIVSISFYKYQATSFNHGKNSSRELTVTAADRKAYLAVLQEVVTDPSDNELETLLGKIENNSFGKERQFSKKKQAVTLLDQNGTKQTVKLKTILKAIQISHDYLEILYNDKVFIQYPKDFPPEICPVLHDILSFVETDLYYRIDDLRYMMSMREVVAAAEDKYPLLRQAVIDDDIEKVRELAQYAKLVPAENPEGAPLFHAVKDERLAIAKILLENGAYTVEMDRNGSRFPLEVAYQTGNRDMVRLLLAYHGALSKTYGVTKHNTDNVVKLCAANKDYEILELMAPEAYTFDTRTWASPEMFPDMTEDTIRGISHYKGIRMSWGLDQIRPVYENKEYDLCRSMLLQGSTKEVVDFFVAQNDYEMFEASVQCHATVYVSNETCNLAFERGGKWIETLSKHVVSLHQKEDSFFAKLLNNGEVDRYLQIIENRGCPFKGLGGYMVWPEKVEDPAPYLRLIRIFIDRVPELKGRLLFLEDIVRYFGDKALAKEYYSKYPLDANTEWWPFRQHTIEPKYILDDKVKNPYAGAELIRSFFVQDVEDKGQKAYQLFSDLVSRCSLWKPLDKEKDESKLYSKEVRCHYMLRALLDCVPLRDLNEVIAQNDRNHEIENAYQYAAKYGKNIRDEIFLNMLRADC